MQNSRSIYTTKAQYNERRPNQERTGENRTGGRRNVLQPDGTSPDRAAQSLQVLEDLSLCASQEAKKKREDAAAESGAAPKPALRAPFQFIA